MLRFQRDTRNTTIMEQQIEFPADDYQSESDAGEQRVVPEQVVFSRSRDPELVYTQKTPQQPLRVPVLPTAGSFPTNTYQNTVNQTSVTTTVISSAPDTPHPPATTPPGDEMEGGHNGPLTLNTTYRSYYPPGGENSSTHSTIGGAPYERNADIHSRKTNNFVVVENHDVNPQMWEPKHAGSKLLAYFFALAALISFILYIIPAEMSTWFSIVPIQNAESFYFSSRLGFYGLLVIAAFATAYHTLWQAAALACLIATIVAVRLPAVIVGCASCVQLVKYYDRNLRAAVQTSEPLPIQCAGNSVDDCILITQVSLVAYIVEGVIDVLVLSVAVWLMSKRPLYETNSTIKWQKYILCALALFAAFLDTLPQNVMTIEVIKAIDPYVERQFLTTGTVAAAASSSDCRFVFPPFAPTISPDFSGVVSPYFFTIFVIWLAIGPIGRTRAITYSALIRTVSTLAFFIMVLAQLALLISRSYLMNHMVKGKYEQFHGFAECMMRPVAIMIVCRLLVFVLSAAIGIIIVLQGKQILKPQPIRPDY